MKAIQIAEYGKPIEVAMCVELPDVGRPNAGEVIIEVEVSPINQYDLLMVAGGYGYRPQLPIVAGTEGVGRVVAVGSDVKNLKEGDRTLVPFLTPAWTQRTRAKASWLRPLPAGDVHQYAMLGVNPPTAYLLLTSIVKMPPGSWVIQNGANSGVGRAVAVIAKSMGLKTVNVVRRAEVIPELKAQGCDVVVLDGPDLAKRVATETGAAPIAIALDGIADLSPMNLMSCLTDDGVLVSYGGTSRKPIGVHPGNLIFRKQTIRGFWLFHWYQSASPDEITTMFDRLAPLVADGKIFTPVAATFGLEQISEAIARSAESGGKILLAPRD